MRAAIMKIMGGVALLAVPATAQAVDYSTMVHWTTGAGANGHYYLLTSSASNFDTAEADAIGAGGQLVSIASAQENAFLVSAFHMVNNDQNSAFWIGFVDTNPGAGVAGFSWLDGSPVSYTNWDYGQPDFCGCDGAEPGHVVINGFGSVQYGGAGIGGWSDEGGNGYNLLTSQPYFPMRGIVELDGALPGSVPEPSAWAMMLIGFAGIGSAIRRHRTTMRFA